MKVIELDGILLWLLLFALAIGAFVVLGGGCGVPTKQVATGVLDVSDAICQQLDSQDEPDFVKFSCSAISVTDKIAHTFLAKVHRDDAAAFAARRCTAGKVAP